jgi:D-sedoheptulose 7-phosphate isomerase
MNITDIILQSLNSSKSVINETLSDPSFISSLELASKKIIETYKNKGKVMLAGNGGSAADCQHICAELVGRLNFDRKPLPAVALTTNSSNLTCISNDYGYSEVFARQMEAIAQPNDTLILYSTSGMSKNILILAEKAKRRVKNIISLTGEYTSDLEKNSDIIISVKSKHTAKIQEVHAIAGHIICEIVEENIFGGQRI